MFTEPFPTYQAQDYLYKISNTAHDMRGFWDLRQQVFCEEQGLFEGNDRDQNDGHMIPIVCKTFIAGIEDEVVGCVRIHEIEPGLWKGSRLAVHKAYRRLSSLSSGVNVRSKFFGPSNLGAGLIYKAVVTANEIGCYKFVADVQYQNKNFFKRLHWSVIGDFEHKGIKHYKMEANLDYYQPQVAEVS